MQNVNVGDRVLMRKPHPCGSNAWAIYRVGADIGLRCIGCGRRVMLTRREFFKGLKQIVHAADESQNESAAPVINPFSQNNMDE